MGWYLKNVYFLLYIYIYIREKKFFILYIKRIKNYCLGHKECAKKEKRPIKLDNNLFFSHTRTNKHSSCVCVVIITNRS